MTPRARTPQSPLTVAVVDHELVCCGVEAMLAPFADTIEFVRLEPGQAPARPVDIVLVDTCSRLEGHGGPDVDELVRDPHVGTVVLYTWSLTETVVASARKRGVHCALPKSLGDAQLARALRRVPVGGGRAPRRPAPRATRNDRWPGKDVGLTPRESEVVSLVTSGLSNGQIAAQTYLSINSVKSYIRSAYRSMGVTTRSQAVLWGIDNGMAPTHMSLVLPPAS